MGTNKIFAALIAVCFTLIGNVISPTVLAQAQDGEALYTQNCSTCHDNPIDRAPSRQALADYNPNAIFHALDAGVMRSQGAALSAEQKIVLAEHLTGGSYNRDRVERFTACASPIGARNLQAATNWNGWGTDLGSSRHQSASATNINKTNIANLEVAWAIGVEGASAARAQPAIIDGVVIMGSPSGQVYALDLATGCHYWTYAAIAEVRAAPSVVHAAAIDQTVVIVADQSNRVYALDFQTGLKLWHADVDANPWAVSTGAPVVFGDKVFVPVSSMEVAGAGNPQHACCTFRGNVAALDLNTGEKLWHTFIMEEPTVVGKNSVGNDVMAPSGAPIWGSASFDSKRNRVYVGSGQNYSRPTSNSSDSVIAFDADTGNIDWLYQTTANDQFIMGCGREHPNCPDPGPDIDIGAPILSTTLSTGKDVLVAGTKGAMVYALDPDANGAVLWQRNVGRGSPLGGVHWGMALSGDTVFVPVSDRIPGGNTPPQPGLHAIDIKTGDLLWYAAAANRCEGLGFSCNNGYSAPATVLDDIVLAGALNGVLFAHDKQTGEILWELDMKTVFATVNNVPATGGAFDATGPVLSGDYMIVNSGYAQFGQLGGNAMVVYKLP